MIHQLVYLAEKTSEHPIAQAICKKIEGLVPDLQDIVSESFDVINFKNRNGEGIVANIYLKQARRSIEVLCGNSKLMDSYQVLEGHPEIARNISYLEEGGKTVVLLSIDGVPQMILSLEEEHLSKPDAQEVVHYLQKVMGMRVCMITGDNKHSALKVAEHLKIDPKDVTYSAYPETKRDVVMQLQRAGHKVMFIGDGINDSPVLAEAHVGCAINSASDITVGAAGIVLMKDSLQDVLFAILIARKTYERIKINFLFAFLYNTILIPVAMGVFYPIQGFSLDPMFAAIAMAASSISVVTSSLMLKRYKPNLKGFKRA